MLPAESKSHFPGQGCQHPEEILKYTWTRGGQRHSGLDATVLVAPSTLGLGWQSCHGKLSILTVKQPRTQ